MKNKSLNLTTELIATASVLTHPFTSRTNEEIETTKK